MEQVSKRQRFLTTVAYWAVLAGIVYLVFRYLLNLLLPFIVALLVSWLLRPLLRRVNAALPYPKLRGVIAVAAVLLVYLIIGGLLVLFSARLISGVSNYLSRLPALYTQSIEPGLRELYVDLQGLAERFDPSVVDLVNRVLPEVISSVGSAVSSFSVGAVGRITGFVTSLPSILISALIAIIATIFTAVSYDRMKAFLKKNLPAKVTETAGYVVASFRNILGQYGKSYLLVMLITFAELAVGLLIIGVAHPFLAAALIAVFDIFPIVGAGMILGPWGIISLIQGKTWQGLGLFALYVVIMIIRQILEPKIVGKQVGLPPLVTLACMFVGSSLFGMWGLFGFPITAAILVNLNNDPDVPIHFFTSPEAEENPTPGKTVYPFRKKGEKPGGKGKKP